jgi:hypothetical protein
MPCEVVPLRVDFFKMAAAHLEKVEKDTMGKKKLVNEFF